jgi:hypothetical protein
MGDIKSGPSVYYSPEAYSYFLTRYGNIPSQVSKDIMFKSYNAAISLANEGSKAVAAIPVLIEKFPVAYHVSEIRNAQYAGEGTFDDWVQTYITSERNKFLLTSPFLDYNSMTFCEQHIESTHEVQIIEKQAGKSGTVSRALANISIVLKLKVGACALEKITGIQLNAEQNVWNAWWVENGKTFLPASQSITPTVTSPALSSGESFLDIKTKGKYRMSLHTGDEFIGIVEFKDDTSLIFETSDGKPYVFNKSLVKQYELLELPKGKIESQQSKTKSGTVTFDELKSIPLKTAIEVRIKSGSIFKGSLSSYDNSSLKIDVEGSVIPVAREVISQITVERPEVKGDAVRKVEPQKMHGPFDTVYVKNSQTDDWGKALPDFIYSGKIMLENAQGLVLKLIDGDSKNIRRADIIRVVKNTAAKFDEPIRTYAMQLSCSDDMVLVDIPPGKQGRPFFKVCIDKYEYPNRLDVVPQSNISFDQAQKYCEQQGKRLCTPDEWQWACSGIDGFSYPYGAIKDDNKCNVDGAPERSGSRLNCVSKFGAYDMVGNIFEWVKGANGEPVVVGGPYSKCQTVSGSSGSAKPQTGLRCCKSN